MWLITFLLLLFSGVVTHPLQASTKKLVVATEATYPPFEFMDPSGKLTGFDIDIMNAICHETGMECEFVNHPFESLVLGIQTKKFDAVISMITITEERKEKVTFSNPYYLNNMAYITSLKETDFSFLEGQVKGKTIGAQAGTTFEQYLVKSYGSIVSINRYDSINNALLDMKNQRVDVVVGDKPILQWWLKQQSDADFVVRDFPAKGNENHEQQVGIAIAKDNHLLREKLNRGLQIIKDNGTYDKILHQYFASTTPKAQGFYYQLILGTRLTLIVALCTLIIGLTLGLLGAAAGFSSSPLIRIASGGFLALIRSLPELLVLLVVYFGGSFLLTSFGNVTSYWAALITGTLGLSLVFASYAAEVFRAAYLAIPSGQQTAAMALGLSKWVTLKKILLPQIIQHALPGLSNLWLVLLKDTSLIALLGLADLMSKAQMAARTTHRPFVFYALAAAIYLVITMISQGITSVIQRKFQYDQ